MWFTGIEFIIHVHILTVVLQSAYDFAVAPHTSDAALFIVHIILQEMMGLTYFMLDQSRKDAEYCMENAFITYLVCVRLSKLDCVVFKPNRGRLLPNN